MNSYFAWLFAIEIYTYLFNMYKFKNIEIRNLVENWMLKNKGKNKRRKHTKI
jgi:hypothetical protein